MEIIIGPLLIGGVVIVLLRVFKVKNQRIDGSYGYFVPQSGRRRWASGYESMDEAVGDAEAAIDNWTEVE
jgi:hypothetical protein